MGLDEDAEPSLRYVMSVLRDISARLLVNEETVDNLTSHRVVQGLPRKPSPVPAEVQREEGSSPQQPKIAEMLFMGLKIKCMSRSPAISG